MRTFTCYTYEGSRAEPTVSVILAADETRARDLLSREFSKAPAPSAVEIREGGRLVWRHAAWRGARHGAPGEAAA